MKAPGGGVIGATGVVPPRIGVGPKLELIGGVVIGGVVPADTGGNDNDDPCAVPLLEAKIEVRGVGTGLEAIAGGGVG
jgi:hypothetical protein